MMIFIFRHGEAVEAAEVGGSDDARMLTPKGKDVTRRAAQGVKALDLIPSVILSSPLVRARETAHVLTAVLGRDIPIHELDELRPGGDPGSLMGLIEDESGVMGPGSFDGVMVVGHNPHLEATIAYLISRDGRAQVSLKKSGLAVIESPRPLGQGTGTLTGLWGPKQLVQLAQSAHAAH